MLHPLIEQLPGYVVNHGRKNLSVERVETLRSLISKLEAVNSEDLGNSFNSIGIIYIYLNEIDNALTSFEKSLSYEYNELAYANYLQALERAGRFKDAITQGLSFLEKNPNNKRIFATTLEIFRKYPSVNNLANILSYYKYQFNAEICIDEEENMKAQTESDLELLESLKIDLDYFNLVSNIAFLEVKKIQIGTVNFHTYLNKDIDLLSINLDIPGINKEDIKTLNKNFDNQINQLVDNKTILFDTYIDHLMKFSFSFTANKSLQWVV